jgi:hypothetical protein
MKSLVLAFVCAIVPVSLYAQGISQIQGIVTDATGSAVAGADVKATRTDTGTVRTTTTGADGVYILPDLAIGPYTLEVGKTGFTSYVQRGIVLQVATNPTVDVKLNIGAVTEQIQVEANAALVDTQGTSIGAVIENRRILELPLNGRNPVELIQLAGAAVPGGRNGTAGFPGGLNFSVAGGLLSGVTYFLDGALYNNPFDAVNMPFPFPDALQEFKVETSSLTAQNGLHSAAAVEAIVKSGTNQYHGDAFEFFRNGDMNARNVFASRRDTLKRNQYGGTLGGPIRRNKLFFFGGYQGTKTRSDPANLTGFVPTQRMLAGDFSGCGFNQLKDPVTGAKFTGNQIDPTKFTSQALAIVKMLPAAVGPCGQVPYGPVTKINEYQMLGRSDYQINSKQSLFGRYLVSSYQLPPAYAFSKNILDTVQGGLDDLSQSATIGHTYLITPNVVNAVRVALNRVGVHRYNDDYFSACDINVKFTCFVPHQTVVNVSAGPAIGVGTAIQASFIPTYYTLSDDVSVVRGAHQFGFGFSGYKYQHSQKANVFSSAAFGFNGVASGSGMSDFLLGQLDTLTQGTPNTTFTYKWYYGLYAQDAWKVSRRFTANLGLRWEPFLPQGITNGAVYNFSWDRFNKGIHSTVFKNAPAGLLYAGDPGFNGKTGVQNRYDQFGPRLGLAFDPKGDGKTSIRASFGISYDFPNIMIMSTPTTAPPFGNTVQPAGPLNFANPWGTVAGGDPFTLPFGPNSPFVRFGSFVAQQPDAKATTVYTWNFSLQHQFGATWLVSASYLGTETAHLWVSEQANPAVLVPSAFPTGTCPPGVTAGCNSPGNINQRRLAYLANPQDGQYLGFVDQFESGGTVHYNGLILSSHKRLSKGVSFDVNYTWSHCIGDITQASSVGGAGAGLIDPNNRRFDRGNCQTPTLDGTQALDRRHIFNFTAVLQSPKFNGRLLRAVGSDWMLATGYRRLSAAELTATTGIDIQLSGSGNQRPNQILANPLCDHPRPTCWINPAAFQPTTGSTNVMPFGTLGNLGRSNIPGPGFWDIDMALSRIFRVHEQMTLEARGEAFNLTNSFRAGAPGQPLVVTGRNSTQFGQILTAQDPRIMQVALKFVF